MSDSGLLLDEVARGQVNPKSPARGREGALLNQLIAVLSQHAGERGVSEGAVECLKRIIRERDGAVYCWEELTGERQLVPGLTSDLLTARNVFACWHNASKAIAAARRDGAEWLRAYRKCYEAADAYEHGEHAVKRVLGLEGT